MSLILKGWLLLAAVSIPNIFINCKPDWTFDLISVETIINTPDIVAVDLFVSRPSRGVFALSGVIDFKVDVVDYALYYVDVYFSPTGSNFMRSPFRAPKITLPVMMNTFYKDILMESLKECGENAPEFEGEFVAPLTSRVVRFNDCILSNDNMPSKMKSGYYKVIVGFTKQAEGYVEILAKIENDNIII